MYSRAIPKHVIMLHEPAAFRTSSERLLRSPELVLDSSLDRESGMTTREPT
jgi:hypothetical protein